MAPATVTTTPKDRIGVARDMVERFEAELKATGNNVRRARLHCECGRLLENPLGDAKRAAEHYRKAHELLPEHVPALQGARRVLIQQKAYPLALSLFDAEAKVVSAAPHKAALYYEKGMLLEEQMGKKAEAREAFAKAVELDPDEPAYLKAVERCHLQSDAWQALDHTYEQLAHAVRSDPRHRAAVIAGRARLLEAQRGESESATELFRLAFEIDPQAPGVLNALKRLHYEHRRWKDLIDVLDAEVSQVSDTSARAMALYRMARTYVDRLGDVESGITALERAVQETPNDLMILEELSRLYQVAERHEALARSLEKLIELTESTSARVGYMHRVGQLHEENLKSEDRAVSWYERALELDAAYLPALQALSALYTKRQQWQPLVEMLLREAEKSPEPERRAAGFARVAEIQEQQLGSVEEAVRCHVQALGVVTGYEPSFKALVRLYSQAGRYRELAELYERAVDEASDAEAKITYLFKIGRLHEDALGAPGQALSAYRRILEVEPKHLGAIHALQRAAERGARYKELIQALELEASKVTDKKRRLSLWHRAGEVAEEHLDDAELALSLYRKVLQLDAAYVPALASIGRLYYRAGRWEELLEIYWSELKVTPRGTASAALLFKMGQLCEERLGKGDEALKCYRQAIEADAFHVPSLHALGRKLAESGQWQELVKLFGLELSSLKDAGAKARLAFRMGEVYENRLHAPDKALAAYEQALSAVGNFRPALDGRARLLSHASEWKRLVEELGREAQGSVDPVLKVAALLRQGEIWRDELHDPRRAIETFESILAMDPGHLGALLALEPLYAQQGNWEPLAGIYEAQARVLGDVRARVAALRELARLQERREDANLEEIKHTYFAILQLAPADLGALGALSRIALQTGDEQLLAEVAAKLSAAVGEPTLAASELTRLAEILEAAGDRQALNMYRAALGHDADNIAAIRGIGRMAERLRDPELLEEAAEREARISSDGESAARLLVQSAEVRATQQNDTEGAIRALEKALEHKPEFLLAAERLQHYLLGSGQFERLLEALGNAAQNAKQTDKSAALWIMTADLLANHKQDIGAALAALNRVQKDLKQHVPTLMKLSELYARSGQWQKAVDSLGKVLQAKPDAELEVSANLQLAEILDEHLNDKKRALQATEAALSLDERNWDALKRLSRLKLEAGDAAAAAEAAAKLVEASRSAEARAEASALRGHLERKRGNVAEAGEAFEQAVSFLGSQGEVAKEFKDMLVEQKLSGGKPDWARYAAAFARYIEQRGAAAEDLGAAYLELSRVQYDEMRQRDQAIATLRQALKQRPSDVALRTELASRLKRVGQLPEALAELYRLLELDVMRDQTFRDLVEVFTGLSRHPESTLSIGPLIVLGAANEVESGTWSSRPSRSGAAHPGSFGAEEFRSIDALGGSDAATELLESLSDVLGKVHPPELERYGLSSRDKIAARSGHPLRAVSDRVAAVFGVVDYDLYLHQAHSGALEVQFTDPVGIMVPAYVSNLPESQQIFLFARVLGNLARRTHAVDALAPQALELLFAAAARNVSANFGTGLADEDHLNSHARRVHKSVSWLSRGRVDELAYNYAAAPRVDMQEWVRKVKLTAARAAVLLADDLPGSVGLVRRMEGDLSRLPKDQAARGARLVHDLMRFWVSEPAFALRRRVGLL